MNNLTNLTSVVPSMFSCFYSTIIEKLYLVFIRVEKKALTYLLQHKADVKWQWRNIESKKNEKLYEQGKNDYVFAKIYI